MDIYELKSLYYRHHPHGHYFDADTLKFFGERLSEMRVLKGFSEIADCLGEKHRCYCVSSVQHKAPGGPRRHYAWFDTRTLEQIIPGSQC